MLNRGRLPASQNELRNRWSGAKRTGFHRMARSRLCLPLARVPIPRRRHNARSKAGSFWKRPALLFAILRSKRAREITFGRFEDLPPGTLRRDVLEGLWTHRRLQNKSGQSPTLGLKCNKAIESIAGCFCHDPPLCGLALEFRNECGCQCRGCDPICQLRETLFMASGFP